MKKILSSAILLFTSVFSQCMIYQQPKSDEFFIVLTESMNFDMPLFGFSVAGTPFNQSYSYTNIPASTLQIMPFTPPKGYYVKLPYNAIKNWDGKFVATFNTDMGSHQYTEKIDPQYLKAGKVIRINFYREKTAGDKRYDYKYFVTDVTNQ